jgi:hypothetical protein
MIGIDDTRDDKHYGSVALGRAFQSQKYERLWYTAFRVIIDL